MSVVRNTGTNTDNSVSQYQFSETADAATKELGETQFLELLVAQLNNQNPLDPQDNTEFIAQLAQLSTVEGINKLNTSLESILSDYQTSQALRGATLVGRSVIVEGSKAVVDTAKTFNGSLVLPASSSKVFVDVYDASGTPVDRIELGEQAAGTVNFMWDGQDSSGNTLSPGTYTFKAQATYDGESQDLTTFLPATVDTVTLGQNGSEMVLNLAGVGSVTLSQVQVIGQ
ncbi:flagellar basal-body rod modification protein FlgD [Azomonas agilis]|uniref:Basal-body rod modification protein FlgD n=1 Tax=Azomonas agilis TaxID=116849 RepID=A0A562I1R5_9GAMM|nr:flagellar hook assembly protein FlgD [Azomonas agilis]TWH64989.1 flagellar basal-body rod modification protein FlgD [Azomonas agilis]